MNLQGKGFLSLRQEAQNSEIRKILKKEKARLYSFPVIQILPPSDGHRSLDAALSRLSDFDLAIFTSANGVTSFFERLKTRAHTVPANLRVVAVGPATAAALSTHVSKHIDRPQHYAAEGLLEWFQKRLKNTSAFRLRHQKILIPQAERARNVLPKGLKKLGFSVTVAKAYRTLPPPRCDTTKLINLFKTGKVDFILFSSTSTVTHFFNIIPKPLVRRHKIRLASIGPITSQALDKLGIPADVEAREHTISGLIKAIKRLSGTEIEL